MWLEKSSGRLKWNGLEFVSNQGLLEFQAWSETSKKEIAVQGWGTGEDNCAKTFRSAYSLETNFFIPRFHSSSFSRETYYISLEALLLYLTTSA